MILFGERVPAWMAWFACCGFTLLTLQARSERIALGEDQIAGQRIDSAPLLEIEKHVLPTCVVPGPWAFESLAEYYWATNSGLKSRFEAAHESYETVKRGRPYQAMTLVAGVAGLGKTFVKGEIFADDCPDSDICKFDLKELYAEWRSQGKTQDKPDLCSGNVVLNSLMSVPRPKDKLLYERLVKQDAKFYVIDSIDEIHPDDYVEALLQIEDFVFRTGRDFVHVVVLGRPFALCEYWSQSRSLAADHDLSMFVLNPPQLQTTGDLQVSSWNYHGWKYKLAWTPAETRKLTNMPLHAYAEWTRLGFDQSGNYQTVSYQPNANMHPQVHDELTKWAREKLIVGSMLCNLAGNSILREIVSDHVAKGRAYNERDVMEAYLAAWFVRNTRSDDRPSQTKPEHLDLYLRLLEGVAVKYLNERKVDKHGFFAVREDDMITAAFQQSELSFPVKRILNRSGLVFVDPRRTSGSNYRFEPIWMHRLLVEKHNDRQRELTELHSNGP